MRFLHTMIRVANIEKSLDFYQNILGLKLDRSKELEDATLYFLKDDSGCCEIELTYNHETPKGGYELGNAFGHLAFATENMNEFSEKLKQHDLEYYIEPFKLTAVGSTIAFVKDPDGYQIEIIMKDH